MHGFVYLLHRGEDGGQFPLDVGAGGMRLDDEIVAGQQFHDTFHLGAHRDTGAERDDL